MAMLTEEATVNAEGSATVTIRNGSSDETWHVDAVTVQLSDDGDGEARLYMDAPSPSTFLEGTYSGGRDTNTIDGFLAVEPGHALTVVWSGATPGETATMGMRFRVERKQF